MKREQYKSLRTISHEEPLGPGGPLCAGCGGLLCLRLFNKALGENVIFVNAAGCFTLLATYPFTPLRASWIYTAMACAPAGAQGVRDALDILKDKGKLPQEEDRKVVVFSQWRNMLRLAEWATRDVLEQYGLRAVFFTGAEKQELRL